MKNKSKLVRLLSIITIAVIGLVITLSIPSQTNARTVGTDERGCTRDIYVDISGINNIDEWCSGTVSITYTISGVVETLSQPFVHGVSQYRFGVHAGISGTVTPSISLGDCTDYIITVQSKSYLTLPCGSYYGHIIWIATNEN